MPAPISGKSTKAELLEAFENMKKQYEELKSQETQPPLLRRKEEDAVLQKTSSYNPATLEDNVSALRKKLTNNLDELQNQLVEEGKKLVDLREAIQIETARLKETRQIELAAETLDIMLAEFERREKESRTKQAQADEALAEQIARKKKEWEREQEEYIYAQKIARKKEGDAYEAECVKKETLSEEKIKKREADVEAKETAIDARGEQIAAMEKEIAGFASRLEDAVQTAAQARNDELTKEFSTEKRLMEQEWKAEKMSLETRIAGLQETVRLQTTEIKSLKDALSVANQQAQTLAATVIESVSGAKQTAKAAEST